MIDGQDESAPTRLSDWLRAGAATLLFRAPGGRRLIAHPATLVAFVVAKFLLTLLLQRVAVESPSELNPWAWLNGGSNLALAAWLCWVVARSNNSDEPPQIGVLLIVLLSMSLLLVAISHGIDAVSPSAAERSPWLAWSIWLLPLLWFGLAQMRLLWRHAASTLARGAIVLVTSAQIIISGWLAPVVFWTPTIDPDAPQAPRLTLTQDVVDAQPRLLTEALTALRPQQPGRVDVFAVTYAPYATQDVFLRESGVVAKTLGERFGAASRTVQLVVNPATASTLPWATPQNLRKTITHIASRMNREEDVFFIHLTSHGGYDGNLAVDSYPLESEPLTPQLLKAWLDEAGIRWRVISVSACYSGSWLAPLKDAGTLVMTAADASHTSYGCGSRSELTFFGRAMYVDALARTRSFEQAHAEARLLIDQREKEAGKSDGYSNPQLQQGEAIRPVLQRLERELSGGSLKP